jgi:GH15 family glucan-1,4-alpha-glucosidase
MNLACPLLHRHCVTTALIAPDGAVEWMCRNRPDSASVSRRCLTVRPDFSASGRVQVYGGSAPVLAIADELTVDGPVLRYRPEQTDDGLTGAEGTFTICSGWRRRWR